MLYLEQLNYFDSFQAINYNQSVQKMKTDRSLRILRSKNIHKKESNSPTYQLQNSVLPVPILKRDYGQKHTKINHFLTSSLSDFSDEEEDNSGVVVQEDENQVAEKKKVLPHFKLINDKGQFLATRSRIKSEQKFFEHSPRCKSVESLKLPQVMEQKKQEDQLHKMGLSKLSQFTDKNQFGQRSVRISEGNEENDNKIQILQPNAYTSTFPQKIIENDNEQTKSDKVKNDKSTLDNQLQKFVVDEVDDRKKKKQDAQQQIQEIIEEQCFEEDIDNVNKLRVSLDKFQHQTEMLNKFKDEELRVSRNNSQNNSEQQQSNSVKKHHKKNYKHHEPITQVQHNQ